MWDDDLKIIAIDSSHDAADSVMKLASPVWAPLTDRCWVGNVASMVSQVLKIAGGKKIWRLVICGHGSPGFQSVGCGKRPDPIGWNSLQLSPGTTTLLGPAAIELRRLAGHFRNDGFVSLAGCAVAGHGGVPAIDGKYLLKAVSRALGGISVEGATGEDVPAYPFVVGALWRCNEYACWLVKNGEPMFRGY